jgi:aryl-alcohol dehydrogenase-like predicted oxidoreductase
MKHLLNKLILGTVQFGLDYGINNITGKTTFDEIQCILSLCGKYGILKLDTSQAYGDSEEVLGKLAGNEFHVISKYSNENSTVAESFRDSLKRLNKRKLYGYLVHHLDSLKKQPSIWTQMMDLKNKGLVEKTGFSIYTTEELEYLFTKNIDFDLIQFPYNIFDRSFESYFSALKQKNVEIHIRSVFLQGLFFKNPDNLPPKISPLSSHLRELITFCREQNISIEELALNAVIHNKNIDGVLIGVDNHAQLIKNIKSILPEYTVEMKSFVNSIIIKEKNLLKPINWN